MAFYGAKVVLSPGHKKPMEHFPEQYGLRYEPVRFKTSDGLTLSGWFVPAEGSHKTVLLCHGWAGNKGRVLNDTYHFHQYGLNLFYFDFRAHGDSQGKMSSILYLESLDFEAALRFLKENKPEHCSRLGVYGVSMGGAVAIRGSALHPEVKAVAIDSTFTTYREVIYRYSTRFYGVPSLLVPLVLWGVRVLLGADQQPYSPLFYVGNISPRPLFYIHSDSDPKMPLEEGRRLFASAGEPKEFWLVRGAKHGECSQAAGDEYHRRVGEFFQKHL